MLSWAEHEKCFISSRPGYTATTDHMSQTDLQFCQPRVTVASCFVYKIIRNLELIDHLCINSYPHDVHYHVPSKGGGGGESLHYFMPKMRF